MLTYSFEEIGTDSLYEHLYKCIKHDILAGTLQPDYKLPSKRSFAKNLGISTITIENAYEQLIAEGYIYSIPKKGYYISDISTLKNLNVLPHMKLAGYNASNHNLDHNKQMIPDSRNTDAPLSQPYTIESQPSYIANFTNNRTSQKNFPFYTWSKLMKDIIADRSDELLVPSNAKGIYELRAAIASHLFDFRGMNVSPDQIIIGAGTEYLYSLLIILLGRAKTFALEDPGYSKIRMIYESNGVNCACIPLDDDGIQIPELERSGADIVHISPSHHYPTGIVTPISRRYEILGWASKDDCRYIIEDDYDCEFRLLGKPIPSLQSIDVSDKVIYMNTFTKSLSPTIRISYMVLPKSLLTAFQQKLGFYACTVSNFEQYTLARFISDGHFEKHINRMRIYYRNQRDLLIDAIKQSPLSSCVTIQEKDAGLHFLMTVDTAISDEELTRRASENGLKITCLSQYYYHKTNALQHTLVINYSAIEADGIEQAVSLLYQSIR